MSAKAHFRLFGIPVHVQPVFFVIAGLFGLRYIDYGVDVVVIWIATSFISILVHELGHGVSLKVFGEPSSICGRRGCACATWGRDMRSTCP